MNNYRLDPKIYKYKLNELKKFVKKGNSLDDAHKNVFIQSISEQDNDIVERYLVCGMNPDTKVDGISAITVARVHRCYGIIKMLILAGLNLSERYENEENIIEYAKKNTRNDEAMLVMTIERSVYKKSRC